MTIITLAYMAYFAAETFKFSGIFAMISCGLMQSGYARHNISKDSDTSTQYFVRISSKISETFIFFLLGHVLVIHDHEWNTTFVVATTSFITIVRIISKCSACLSTII